MGRNVEFNKEETVKKAMNVFWEKGYNGTSMQDLVDAMQINRSSLYNTIGDKQQLFHECVNDYANSIMCQTLTLIKDETSALNALKKIIAKNVESTIDCKGCLGTKSVFEMANSDSEVKNILRIGNDSYLEILTNLVGQAIEAGEIANDEKPETVADYIFNSFTGWKQSYILHGDPIKIKKMSEYLIRNITHK